VDALLKRTDLPTPNYLIKSSPGKWQVIWKVNGFGKAQAERLQKSLAAQTGADPAATDCARVLRLPGFYNHKYATPHFVEAQSLTDTTYRPARFPALAPTDPAGRHFDAHNSLQHGPRTVSQSERDWAYAKRALARGESPALVAAAMASYRRYDKHNPQYYADLTVRKATDATRILGRLERGR
jgi:RepB DNA-primase from phage plasmid